MQFLFAFLTHTPSWVWALLAFLVFLGLSRTRSRPRSFTALVLPSIIFVGLALSKIVAAMFAPLVVFGTLAGALVAVAAIVALKPARNTRQLENGRIFIEGEWLSLVMVLAVFSFNYAGVALAMTGSDVAHAPAFVLTTAIVNGFTSAFMSGRAVAHLLAANRSSSVLSSTAIKA